MSAIVFTLRHEPPERLDLSRLVPDVLVELTKSEIEKIEIGTTKYGSRVGDIFRVKGNNAANVVFEAGSARFDGVGTGMTSGEVRVAGEVGAQTGRLMRGGSLLIEGDAGPFAASCMSGGRLEVRGNAGDRLGGPLAGEMAGMKGGVVIIRGRAGERAANRMRRGLIAVGKGSGDYAGSRMIAGTLVVLGKAGAMPGYLMRRGTIVLGKTPTELSPGFVETGAPEIAFSGLLDRWLVDEGILDKPLLGRAPRRWGGDNAVLGLGEVFVKG
ncbi:MULTISPECIES: formylmethanofuran dehydrogenase subunit C [Mesorhizobium]|uniref:Formylmethanofuran dehydrogenase subunit C n=1 Tax=Mesorhizobium denitrificans TaxID=2294114 RepID=A0A371XC52_9HYPH|nr:MULTISPECIES: formylmethanofuran dehydrogenase subunit C [Mesorhizobium]RFC66809.1 formylmethanofuran dehydrogenase subunit C [Mesorhizobium denitrificans]